MPTLPVITRPPILGATQLTELSPRYVRSSLNVIRAPDPGIFHLWHPKLCSPGLPGDQYRACISSRALSEASHAHLGLVAFKKDLEKHPVGAKNPPRHQHCREEPQLCGGGVPGHGGDLMVPRASLALLFSNVILPVSAPKERTHFDRFLQVSAMITNTATNQAPPIFFYEDFYDNNSNFFIPINCF